MLNSNIISKILSCQPKEENLWGEVKNIGTRLNRSLDQSSGRLMMKLQDIMLKIQACKGSNNNIQKDKQYNNKRERENNRRMKDTEMFQEIGSKAMRQRR